jgi:hypothetical protein
MSSAKTMPLLALSRYPLQAPAAMPHYSPLTSTSLTSVEALEDNEELIDPGIADLVAAMTCDVELQMLKKCIRGDVLHAGLADLLARFCPWIDWISMHKSGLLLVDCRQIVVPQALRQDILKAIHQAHPGLQRSLSLAQCHYIWPGMHSNIAQTVSDCDQCQTVCQAKPVETLP